MSDDEEEAFFRSQMARLEGNQEVGSIGKGGGGSAQEREEEDFFRNQMAKLDVRGDSPPQPTPDKKQGGYLGKLRGITGTSGKKSSKSSSSKGSGGGSISKPLVLPPKTTVPPPAVVAPSKKPPPTAQLPPKSSGRGGEDDDDTDEELLGMSSEDEVEPTRRAALERQETRVMRGQAAARAPPTVRQSSMSMRGAVEPEPVSENDSGEPELWEDVDEQELVRKVREMRLPRGSAPSAPLLRRMSGGVEVEAGEVMDPLGMGPLDLKSIALRRNSSRGVAPPADLQGATEKIMSYDDKFNGRYYLARIHKNTGVAELEKGRAVLQQDHSSHEEQRKQLVKDHFDVFISAKNSIQDIHSRLEQMEADMAGSGTEKLSESLRDCDEVARRAFSPLLERQAQVERIRSVQGLLQRFRTLFNLPSVIRGFVRKGEYDSAVHESIKAKSLNFPVHSGILKRVLEEVAKVVQEFREVLYAQMADPDQEVAEVENKIRLLLELDAESDPIWHYLALQDRRIRGLLEGCALEHVQRLEALHQKTREKQQASQRWKQLQMESVAGSEVDLTLLLGTNSSLLDSAQEVAHDVEADQLHARLIKRLTLVLTQHLPRFWKLALAIFGGKFGAFESAKGYSRHSTEEVAVMVVGIIGLYETKVLLALSQLEHAVELRPYLKQAVGQVAYLCHTLKQRDSAPPQALAALHHLRMEVTRRFVRRVCYITRGAAGELAGKEEWVPAATAERGESPYGISAYPLHFRDALVKALDHMRDVLMGMREDEPHTHMQGQGQGGNGLHALLDSMKTTFSESFFDFCDCLEKMAVALPQAPGVGQEAGGDPGQAGNGDATGGAYTGLQAGVQVCSVDQRILMLLSNAGFCRTAICPHLMERYRGVWVEEGDSREVEQMVGEVEKQFVALETVVGDKYVDIKAGHLGMAVIKYFLEDGTSWATAPPVRGLRDSALELMHPLVAVHAEVYAGCRPFVERAINMLADGLMDALHQVALQHQDLQQLDANAYCQLSLELDYFETVLHPFDSQALKDIVDQLRAMLLERTMEGLQLNDPDGDRSSRRADSADGMPQTATQLKQMAEALSVDLLPGELRRTKINVYCFTGRGGGESISHNPSVGTGLDAATFSPSPYRQGRSQTGSGKATSVGQGARTTSGGSYTEVHAREEREVGEEGQRSARAIRHRIEDGM